MDANDIIATVSAAYEAATLVDPSRMSVYMGITFGAPLVACLLMVLFSKHKDRQPYGGVAFCMFILGLMVSNFMAAVEENNRQERVAEVGKEHCQALLGAVIASPSEKSVTLYRDRLQCSENALIAAMMTAPESKRADLGAYLVAAASDRKSSR